MASEEKEMKETEGIDVSSGELDPPTGAMTESIVLGSRSTATPIAILTEDNLRRRDLDGLRMEKQDSEITAASTLTVVTPLPAGATLSQHMDENDGKQGSGPSRDDSVRKNVTTNSEDNMKTNSSTDGATIGNDRFSDRLQSREKSMMTDTTQHSLFNDNSLDESKQNLEASERLLQEAEPEINIHKFYPDVEMNFDSKAVIKTSHSDDEFEPVAVTPIMRPTPLKVANQSGLRGARPDADDRPESAFTDITVSDNDDLMAELAGVEMNLGEKELGAAISVQTRVTEPGPSRTITRVSEPESNDTYRFDQSAQFSSRPLTRDISTAQHSVKFEEKPTSTIMEYERDVPSDLDSMTISVAMTTPAATTPGILGSEGESGVPPSTGDANSPTANTSGNKMATDKAEEEGNEGLFSTAVDEDVLKAAKSRQQKVSTLLSTDTWGVDGNCSVGPSMPEIIDEKAGEHYTRGLNFLKKCDYQRAILCFNKCINLKPKQVHFYVQRAEAFLLLCDFPSAILNYRRACVLEPTNFDYFARLSFLYFFQGQCYFDQKLYPEALEAFSRAGEMRPEVTGYHTRIIACLAALDRHGECLALVNKSLENNSQNPDLYIMRARLQEMFRNMTLCYYDTQEALRLDPHHSEASKLMKRLESQAADSKLHAMQLNIQGKFREALHKISAAIELNPSKPDFHVVRGALQRRVGDFNAAIDDFLLALDKTNHDEESNVYVDAQRQLLLTYNDFAVECFSKTFYEEAVILLNKAIKGEKKEKGLYINRGDCFFKQGELNFALADYHQALELDPYDMTVKKRCSIIHNEFGVAEYQQKNLADAVAQFTLAIQNNPTTGQYYISRARARHLLEDITGARKDLLIALHLEPQNEEIMAVLPRLFPGKTVSDVLQSHAAHAARAEIQGFALTPLGNQSPTRSLSSANQRAVGSAKGSVKQGLVGLGSQGHGSQGQGFQGQCQASPGEEGEEKEDPLRTWKPSSCLPDLRACILEREFNLKFVREKKSIEGKVKGVFSNRKSLRYTGGHVQPMPSPDQQREHGVQVPDKVKGGASEIRGAGRKGAEVSDQNLGRKKNTGWKQFSLGISVKLDV